MTAATRIVAGGILAAGEGGRLRRDGWRMSKPLVPIAGTPLVERAIENMRSAGVRRIGILFNESEEDCVRFVRSRFPDSGIEVRVQTTASSFETFRELSALLPEGTALFSTVDAWCRPEDFRRFAEEACEAGGDATVLAVTSLVDDERPLWVSCERGAGGGAVRAIGGDTGDCVTAGVYLFPARARELAARSEAGRLREFLRRLADAGEPVVALPIGDVVDIDRGRDVRLAEELALRAARGEAK